MTDGTSRIGDYKIEINNLTKNFGRRLIFKGITRVYDRPGIYGISGPNGSGKSTIVKIFCGILSPNSGTITHHSGASKIESNIWYRHIGFVSPYLVLYDEFTAEENIAFFSAIREINFDAGRSDFLFEKFGIIDRKNDLVKTYSSGMKQRLKYIGALYHNPDVLIFDEPTSNLDIAGKETVYNVIKELSKEKIVFLASNDREDIDLCSEVLDLNLYKSK